MTPTNSHDFLPGMEEIARDAGALLMDYFRQRVTVEYKGEADLVTVADRKSELLIRERLRERWPSFDILGEEGGLQDTGSDYCWYVDPLDGTTNYAHGFPVYCVSLGLAYRGEVVAGVVFDPTRNEMYRAERGAGAYVNNQRLHVSPIENLSESLVATGFPSFADNHDLNVQFFF